MRLAIFSDIHGNSLALDAVLADCERRGGADAYLILGDLVAIGPDPLGVLERLNKLQNATFVYGNTDRYLVGAGGAFPRLADVQERPELAAQALEVARSMAWTQGAVTAAGWLPWLDALPLEARLALPGGRTLLGVHASPGNSDGDGLNPSLSRAQVRKVVAGSDADMIVVGHTHLPLHMEVDGVTVINVGSVSNPFPPDLRASYLRLRATETTLSWRRHGAEYDRRRVVEQMRQVRHPAPDYVVHFMQGQNVTDWHAYWPPSVDSEWRALL